MGLFTTTADDYDKYRQNAPQELIDFVVSATPEPHDTMLDLGTGTGAILEQFLPYFSSALAIEPDEEMTATGKQRLQGKSVEYLNQKAENLTLPDAWQTSLVTICRAFHWMDRKTVLQKLEPVVRQAGVIAIFGSKSIWRLEDEWSIAARSVVQQFLGADRRTVEGTYQQPGRSYIDDLKDSAFSSYQERTFPFDHQFTLDSFTGYLHSTSFANVQLLGDKLAEFDTELTKRLTPFVVDGVLTQKNEFTLLLAQRP